MGIKGSVNNAHTHWWLLNWVMFMHNDACNIYACCGMPALTYAHARPKLLEELKKSEEAVTQKLSVEEGKH